MRSFFVDEVFFASTLTSGALNYNFFNTVNSMVNGIRVTLLEDLTLGFLLYAWISFFRVAPRSVCGMNIRI